MDPSRVTLRDIALRAGLSHVAVSKALRNHPGVSENTRKRIQALALELGYRSNPYVSVLMSGVRTRSVAGQPILALINTWPDPGDLHRRLFHRQFVDGVNGRARELGFATEEFRSAATELDGKRLSRILRTRGIDGIIVLGMPDAQSSLLLDWPHFAAAAGGTSLLEPAIHRSAPSLHRAMSVALEKVRAAGHRRIGLVLAAEQDERNERIWSAAYLRDQLGCRPRDRLLPLIPEAPRADTLVKWLKQERPTALITSLLFLPHLPDWLQRAGIRVPGDLSVVTLYESDLHPEFARVDANACQIGAAAVDLVVAQLHRNERGLPSFRKDVQIAPSWVPGSSLTTRHAKRMKRS